MNKFKKSTENEVAEMIFLYKKGVSLLEIGRLFGKDHTSILYWIKKTGNYVKRDRFKELKPIDEDEEDLVERLNDIIAENQKEVDKIINDNNGRFTALNPIKEDKRAALKEYEISEESKRLLGPNRVSYDNCYFCGKEKKDKRWMKTNYCSLTCWYKSNKKEEVYY